MQLRPLIWKYEGKDHCLWHGAADGLLSHVSFFITRSDAPNEYIVSTDLKGIENVTCESLEIAKDRAQELLTTYAFSLIHF